MWRGAASARTDAPDGARIRARARQPAGRGRGVGACVAVALLTGLLPTRAVRRPGPREVAPVEAADVAVAPHDPAAR